MSITDEEGEMEEQNEQQPEVSHDCSKTVFEVTCGALAGTLYKKRFASGNHISIHTKFHSDGPKCVSSKLSFTTRDLWEEYPHWDELDDSSGVRGAGIRSDICLLEERHYVGRETTQCPNRGNHGQGSVVASVCCLYSPLMASWIINCASLCDAICKKVRILKGVSVVFL